MLLPYLYCKYTNKRARNKKLASLFFTESESIGNNIDVDPTFKCHTERSEVSIYSVVIGSNAFGDVANAHCEIKTSFISLAHSQHSHTFRMTNPLEKFYFESTAILLHKKTTFILECSEMYC